MALILSEMMQNTAHSMAKAAGDVDISNVHGTSSTTGLCEGTVCLLGSIARNGKIHWDMWFRLVVSVITGLPCDMAQEETFDAVEGLFFELPAL